MDTKFMLEHKKKGSLRAHVKNPNKKRDRTLQRIKAKELNCHSPTNTNGSSRTPNRLRKGQGISSNRPPKTRDTTPTGLSSRLPRKPCNSSPMRIRQGKQKKKLKMKPRNYTSNPRKASVRKQGILGKTGNKTSGNGVKRLSKFSKNKNAAIDDVISNVGLREYSEEQYEREVEKSNMPVVEIEERDQSIRREITMAKELRMMDPESNARSASNNEETKGVETKKDEERFRSKLFSKTDKARLSVGALVKNGIMGVVNCTSSNVVQSSCQHFPCQQFQCQQSPQQFEANEILSNSKDKEDPNATGDNTNSNEEGRLQAMESKSDKFLYDDEGNKIPRT